MSKDGTRTKRPRDDEHHTPAPPKRRALSCKECIRRKTKCSALGQTPCDACIKRRKPEDCVWEGGPTEGPTFALAAEVKALQKQIDELRAAVQDKQHRLPTPPSTSQPPSSHTSQPTSVGVDSNSSASSPVLHTPRRIEHAISNLERRVIGPMPGSRPDTVDLAKGLDSLVRAATHVATDPLLVTALDLALGTDSGTAHVDNYFHSAVHQGGWCAVSENVFRHEHASFAKLSPQEQRTNTDPAWLALLLMMVALGVKPKSVFSMAEHGNYADAFFQASVRALEAADYQAVPQIRHIQTALLYVVFLFHFGDTTHQANVALRHLNAAITTAQWLELDTLSDDPSVLPSNDPALAMMAPHSALELCKRLVHCLNFLDATIQKRPGLWRFNNLTTPPPGNYRDDISSLERPAYELTASSLPRVGAAFAAALRPYLTNDDQPYETVVAFSEALHTVLDTIPPVSEPLKSTWMMHILYGSLHNRIMRLHRPYMVQGYANKAFELSRTTAISSSRRVVESQLRFNADPHLRPTFAKRWVLGASLVLSIDYAFGNVDSRTTLLQAVDVFSTNCPSERTPEISVECRRAIQALIAAGDDRHGRGPPEGDPEETLAAFFDDVRASLSADVQNTSAETALDLLFPDLSGFDLSFLSV